MIRNGEPLLGSKPSPSASLRVIEALRKLGPLTRRELGEQTGYSRATVSQVTNQLIDSGTLDELGEWEPADGPRARGRPSAKVRLNPLRATQAGLEIACNRMAFALCDNAGLLILSGSEPISRKIGLPEQANRLTAMVQRRAAEAGIDLAKLDRVVLGLPRSQFPEMSSASQPGEAFRTTEPLIESLRQVIQGGFGAPLSLVNNTRMRALAEAQYFRGNESDLFFLGVDHEIIGALVLGGVLQNGSHGQAGDLGHVSVRLDGAPCRCGNRGCLEQVASMPALLAGEGLADPGELAEGILAGGYAEPLANAIRGLSQATAAVVTFFNPGTLVLGGSVMQLPGFFQSAKLAVLGSVPGRISSSLQVEPAAGDGVSGAIGAMILAFQSG